MQPPPYLDVNGDGSLSPLDALLIINFLNNPSAAPAVAAEGERLADGQLIGAALEIEPRFQAEPAETAAAVDQAVATTSRADASAGGRGLGGRRIAVG